MTAPRKQPETFQGMLDWLESELRQLKQHVAQQSEAADQQRTHLWDLTDQVQRADSGAINLAAQISHLAGLPEEIRALRERVDRLQGILGQDREQTELLGRQVRAEMQTERDERGDLRRRMDFAEQTMQAMGEKVSLAEEVARRVQDASALQSQRLEQVDINLAALDSRLAANAETLRRMQADARTAAAESERLSRGLGEQQDRIDRAQEAIRKLQDLAEKMQDVESRLDGTRDRLEVMRQNNDATTERSTQLASSLEALQARVEDLGRGMERQRGRADQQERAMQDLRLLTEDVRDLASRESERLLTFQEKIRRRQIQDLEQELRDIKAFGRPQLGG